MAAEAVEVEVEGEEERCVLNESRVVEGGRFVTIARVDLRNERRSQLRL